MYVCIYACHTDVSTGLASMLVLASEHCLRVLSRCMHATHALAFIILLLVKVVTCVCVCGVCVCVCVCVRRGNNEEFLSRCAKYAERRKWSHLLQAFKAAVAKVQALDEDTQPTTPPSQMQQHTTTSQDPAAAAQPAAAAADTAAAAATEVAAPESKNRTKKRRKQSGTATQDKPVTTKDNRPEPSDAMVTQDESGKQQAIAAAGSGKASAGSGMSADVRAAWRAFAADLAAAERAAAVAEGGFAFSFVEGKLVTALRQGWWLLLDEINLVS